VQEGHVGLVKEALRYGANPNRIVKRYGKSPDTALRVAVRQFTKDADYPRIIQVLVNAGADINFGGIDEFGNTYERKSHTPLMIHAYQDNPRMDLLDALLACGADVNKRDFDKNTALHIAAEKNHIAFARKLLEAGARISCKNVERKKPKHIAREKGHREFVALLREFQERQEEAI
jgi:ankyrin repeat protein